MSLELQPLTQSFSSWSFGSFDLELWSLKPLQASPLPCLTSFRTKFFQWKSNMKNENKVEGSRIEGENFDFIHGRMTYPCQECIGKHFSIPPCKKRRWKTFIYIMDKVSVNGNKLAKLSVNHLQLLDFTCRVYLFYLLIYVYVYLHKYLPTLHTTYVYPWGNIGMSCVLSIIVLGPIQH
jgi:hypothetical protein